MKDQLPRAPEAADYCPFFGLETREGGGLPATGRELGTRGRGHRVSHDSLLVASLYVSIGAHYTLDGCAAFTDLLC